VLVWFFGLVGLFFFGLFGLLVLFQVC
jgi:hypothetical protein